MPGAYRARAAQSIDDTKVRHDLAAPGPAVPKTQSAQSPKNR
jgi:hypothetical protein